MTRPLVSVIIPHYRDLGGLEKCLEALQHQTFGLDRFDVWVADNNSGLDEATLKGVIRDRANLISVMQKGAGPARNGGVAASSGEILAFTDSDCVPDPGWLEAGVKALANYDFIGGHVKVLVQDPAAMTGSEAFESVFAFDFKTYIEKKGFTGAGNLFCTRAVFDKVGGFLPDVSEDVEWSRRAQSKGFRLGYAPSAVVGHPARHAWDELVAKWRRVNAETYRLTLQGSQGRLRWLARSLLLPASALAHTPRVLFSQTLKGAHPKGLALATLYRLRFWRFADAMRLYFKGI